MTAHYAAPGAPSCRCPHCRPATDAWRMMQRAIVAGWQRTAQAHAAELARQQAEQELADWLKQDVH